MASWQALHDRTAFMLQLVSDFMLNLLHVTDQEMAHLGEALRSTALITLAASIVIQVLDYAVGASAVGSFFDKLFHLTASSR